MGPRRVGRLRCQSAIPASLSATDMIPRVETPLIRYSRWSLAVTVAAMPLYVFRFKAVLVPTTPLEILVLLTIALYVAGRWQSRSWRPMRTWLEIPTALLLIA